MLTITSGSLDVQWVQLSVSCWPTLLWEKLKKPLSQQLFRPPKCCRQSQVPKKGSCQWASDQHLNSIIRHIQFILELENTNGQGLPFLDTITTRYGTEIQVDVYGKSTHTDRYLDFHSHHPSGHKGSVISTLFLRARNIPFTRREKREETRKVKAVFRGNNYPSSFNINECEKALTTKPTKPTMKGFVGFVCPWCLWNDRPSSGIAYNTKPKADCAILHTMARQRDHWRYGYLSTKKLYLVSTKIPKLWAMSTNAIIRWTLTMLRSSDMAEPNYHQLLFLEAYWDVCERYERWNVQIVIPEVYKCLAHF